VITLRGLAAATGDDESTADLGDYLRFQAELLRTLGVRLDEALAAADESVEILQALVGGRRDFYTQRLARAMESRVAVIDALAHQR